VTTKLATPQGVSARLRRAGFTRMTYSKSRIRGTHEHTEGFEVTAGAGGRVQVTWWPSSFLHGRDTAKLARMLTDYTETLRDAGYIVWHDDPGNTLIITARESEVAR
jgi:hypothetical protein